VSYTQVFPTILIALDWRRSIYWLAAAVLTACVTF
jgi:hypothetical protein